MKQHPNRPELVRHINVKMEKELHMYLDEIERRFNANETKNYKFSRQKDKQNTAEILGKKTRN